MPRSAERGGPQTRARIAETAAGLFLERGFDDVTVAEVARAAGVSSVTVFKHFPRKEDLYLDRSSEAVELVRRAVRNRGEVDVLTSLQRTVRQLADDRHPLSGLNERSAPFFRTVAGSPSLIARAREIAAELEALLAAELVTDGGAGQDAGLLAALFTAGYASVLVETARRSNSSHAGLVEDHLVRLDRLFARLRNGFPTTQMSSDD